MYQLWIACVTRVPILLVFCWSRRVEKNGDLIRLEQQVASFAVIVISIHKSLSTAYDPLVIALVESEVVFTVIAANRPKGKRKLESLRNSGWITEGSK